MGFPVYHALFRATARGIVSFSRAQTQVLKARKFSRSSLMHEGFKINAP